MGGTVKHAPFTKFTKQLNTDSSHYCNANAHSTQNLDKTGPATDPIHLVNMGPRAIGTDGC